jgi:hypothetical protein
MLSPAQPKGKRLLNILICKYNRTISTDGLIKITVGHHHVRIGNKFSKNTDCDLDIVQNAVFAWLAKY